MSVFLFFVLFRGALFCVVRDVECNIVVVVVVVVQLCPAVCGPPDNPMTCDEMAEQMPAELVS